ncbi:chaperone protein DnaJ [Actinobacteria bacterium IMCC26256]|nr:chaperone protein DnaJ [Actinobacteria bacterium IMCC26256]
MAAQREWFEKDYYAVLGVPKGSTEKEITRAYRQLAKKFHPDANPGDAPAEERFKEISAAYDVLGDSAKRVEYDEVREQAASGGFRGGPGFPGGGFGGQGFGGGFEGGDISDLIGGLFGNGGGASGGGRGRGRRARSAAERGSDLETTLHVDFLDAVNGVTAPVRFSSDAQCTKCKGSGAEPGTVVNVCSTCGGGGQVAVNQGPFSFSQVCPDCAGSGRRIATPCSECRGRGIEMRSREVKVKIPAGVSDGQRIRVKSRGAAGANGGEPGDLYVVVNVAAHEIFGRSGRNLTLRVPITISEAVLGAAVRVPTLGEPVTVKVKPGTTSGTTVKVSGRGIPAANAKAGPGDLHVTFEIAVPTSLNKEQRAAFETLSELEGVDVRERLGL